MFLIALINNLALLISLSVISGFIKQHLRQNIWPGQVVQGVLFGAAAVIAMLNPLRFSPGVIFDGRTIMISLAGFFFGPLAAVPAGLIAAAYRAYLGGGGVWMGLLTIASSAALGVLFYYRNRPNREAFSTANLLRFGVLVHIFMLAFMTTLPGAIVTDVFLRVAPLVLILFPIVTVVIGKVLIGQDEAEAYLSHLEQSEQRHRLALEGGSLGTWDWNIDGARSVYNERWAQMLGYALAEVQGGSKEWTERIHPDDRPGVLAAFEAMLAGRAPMYEQEFRLRHKNGSWVWVLSRGTVIQRDAAGRALRASGTHLDITERKWNEAEREVTVQFLRLLTTPTHLNDLLRAATGLLQSWSGCETVGVRLKQGREMPYYETRGFPYAFGRGEPSLCRRGADPAGAAGQPLLACLCSQVLGDLPAGEHDCAPPSCFTEAGSFWTNSVSGQLAENGACGQPGGAAESVALIPLRAGGETLGLIKFEDRQPGRFRAEQIAVFERLGEALAIALAQRRAQAALSDSETRYRMLVENVGEGIGYITADERIAFANPAAEKILGVAPGGLVGRDLNQMVEHAALCLAADTFGMDAEGGETEVEVRLDNGELRTLLVNAVPQRDENGDLQGMFVVFRDVTERIENARLLERYRTLAEHSRDIMWFVRLSDGRILEANQAACQAYGYTREEILTRTIHDLRAPQTSKLTRRALEEITEEGITFETLHMSKAGEIFPVEVSARSAIIDGERVLLSVIRDIRERKQAEARIADQLARLSALQAIDNAIIQNLALPMVLDVVLQQVCERLGVAGAGVWLMQNDSSRLLLASVQPLGAPEHGGRLAMGQGRAGQVAAQRSVIWLPDLRKVNGGQAGHMRGYYGAPLISKGRLLGVLEVYHDEPLAVDGDWVAFFNVLAGQAAIAIDDSKMTAGLRDSHDELLRAYEATIEGWSRALDLRDHETEGHSQRVTDMSVALARELGFSEEELLQVRRGALLHDIGKMGVPDPILLKPDALTPEEWDIMRRHPTYAYTLLLPIKFLHPALDIPYCHHEKWDGSGYPRGLRGEAIPLAARIFAVIDVYDALTSHRPYRPAWTPAQACAHIKEQAGKHFDPRVVDAFLQMIEKEGLFVAA